jgi:predicted phage terminase large subunit-like protein
MSVSSATDPQTLQREQEFLLKDGALNSLAAFSELVDPKYRAGACHELLSRKLEDCYTGKIKRLAISFPPRHGKSRTTSVMFPAWAHIKSAARKMALEIIQAGYTAELSEEFSIQTKAVLNSARCRRFFPEQVIDVTHDTTKLWRTVHGGAYFATGVGGGGVGRGADCLTPDTLITTSEGNIPISDINISQRDVYVLSYSHEPEGLCWRRVRATAFRRAATIYRISTASGRVVEATGEHPFFTGKEYTRAMELAPGDRLVLAMPKTDDKKTARDAQASEARANGILLLEQSRSDGSQTNEPRDALSEMSHAIPCCSEIQTVSDSVAMVERIYRDTDVFNLQVEGTENFFANGILTHNCFIIDDPIKNRAEANSQARRDEVWNWFTGTVVNRLSPDGVVIVIQTRWHEDDLIGRLKDPKRVKELEDAGFPEEVFELVNMEAICENPETDPMHRKAGEALWPERWTVGKLQARRLIVGPFEWNAQYQQRPNPPDGNLCDVNRVRKIKRSEVPADMELMRGWDLAISIKTAADYSVGVYGGVRTVKRKLDNGEEVELRQLYIVHIDRDKRAWPDQKKTITNYAVNVDNVGRVGIEAVRGWEVAAQELRETLVGRAIVQDYRPAADKQTRALPWLATIAADNLFIVEGLWNQDFLDELRQFPNCTHDDQVDAVTVLWEMASNDDVLLMA